MTTDSEEMIPVVVLTADFPVPALIAAAGERASWRFLEFFAANIRNKNTREAYRYLVFEERTKQLKAGKGLAPVSLR